jgi:glycosyltransferase involved in cell wall biosynthesis
VQNWNNIFLPRAYNKKIFLPGFIPGAADYLKALDIFVLPSVKEGLPYALMQAMAAGLAVVATRVGGIPDLVGDGQEGLLVPAGDPTRLKTAIAALISSPELREKLGTSAQRKIGTNFPFHAMITKTISMYDAAPNQ